MKKTISLFLQILSSCACTLAVFSFLYLLICGIIGNKNGEAPIYFSDDGNVLSFFGETVFIDRESVESFAGYPRDALVFCKGFLPESFVRSADRLSHHFAENGKCFLTLAKKAVIRFFTVGAPDYYSS